MFLCRAFAMVFALSLDTSGGATKTPWIYHTLQVESWCCFDDTVRVLSLGNCLSVREGPLIYVLLLQVCVMCMAVADMYGVARYGSMVDWTYKSRRG